MQINTSDNLYLQVWLHEIWKCVWGVGGIIIYTANHLLVSKIDTASDLRSRYGVT